MNRISNAVRKSMGRRVFSTSCSFPGAKSTTFNSNLKFQREFPAMEVFRRMNENAEFLDKDYKVQHDDATLVKMYTTMVRLNVMDQIFYDAQRQGRISFYMTNSGEEAIHIGSSAALKDDDVIYAQYREAGVLMYRGFTLDDFANQCFSNELDIGKGRQMPVHYGSNKLKLQTISSPLATQIPQAAGSAYALKREGKGNVVICYFGEGAASEGDFHAALNFASTLDCPVIFFCRNNGYAISTPSKEQFNGDGIASRAQGYGMAVIRVDGNDIFAVHDATAAAREIASKENKPVLVEAMSYRVGHHSTSDDSTRYRKTEEIQFWIENENPITRFRSYLEKRGLWDSSKETQTRTSARTSVLASLSSAEVRKKPAISELFSDVYAEMPQHLKEQQEQLMKHLNAYGDKYGLEEFADSATYVDPSK